MYCVNIVGDRPVMYQYHYNEVEKTAANTSGPYMISVF